jgi:hypothetical protein
LGRGEGGYWGEEVGGRRQEAGGGGGRTSPVALAAPTLPVPSLRGASRATEADIDGLIIKKRGRPSSWPSSWPLKIRAVREIPRHRSRLSRSPRRSTIFTRGLRAPRPPFFFQKDRRCHCTSSEPFGDEPQSFVLEWPRRGLTWTSPSGTSRPSWADGSTSPGSRTCARASSARPNSCAPKNSANSIGTPGINAPYYRRYSPLYTHNILPPNITPPLPPPLASHHPRRQYFLTSINHWPFVTCTFSGLRITKYSHPTLITLFLSPSLPLATSYNRTSLILRGSLT